MQRIGWIGLVLAIATLATTAAAHAQKRVALVIGNGAYTKVPRLDNPKNDAAANGGYVQSRRLQRGDARQ
jgi:hypothetical protein